MKTQLGCRVLFALALALAGCSSSTPTDAGTKPHDPVSDALQGELTQSRNAWDRLVASMGDTYSYAEENCVVNGDSHRVTTIQVDHGAARLFTTTTIARSECLAEVNRYDDFQPHTLPELYDQCRDLIERAGSAVELQFDDQGVIRGCASPGSDGCFDNCGNGFFLRAVTFGTLVVP